MSDDLTPGPAAMSHASAWWRSRTWGWCLTTAYVLLVAMPLAELFAFHPSTGLPPAVRLGRAAALVGFVVLALQTVLSARLRLVDGPFGLDRVLRVHKRAAIIATALVLAHPMLLTLGAGETWRFDFFPEWQIELGEFALGLLVLGVLFAAAFGAFGIRYRTWRLLHKGMIAVVALGFAHGILIGSDLHRTTPRVVFWALFVLAAGVFIHRSAWVPLRGRRRFRVAAVTPETHDTFTLRLEPVTDRGLHHLPGQFVFLKLVRPGRTSEEHPFTVSSAPAADGSFTVTVKKSGVFTNTIDRTRPDDRALIEGPFGRFSCIHTDARAFLFIAGGVGITPIMSMLRTLHDTGDARPAVLVFANKTERDVIFRDELSALPANVKVVHVLSQAADSWSGPKGYVTAEVIREHAGAMLKDAEVYLCGPPPMMDTVAAALRSLDVAKRRIHTERFAL